MTALKFFLGLIVSFSAYAFNSSINEEEFYNRLAENVLHNRPVQFMILDRHDQKVLIDVLWDLKNLQGLNVESYVQDTLRTSYDLKNSLRLTLLSNQKPSSSHFKFMSFALNSQIPSDTDLATLTLVYQEEIAKMGFMPEVELARDHYRNLDAFLKRAERGVGDQFAQAKLLWEHQPDLKNYLDGKYEGGIKLYMFCRTQREFPCLMLAKDSNDRIVTNVDGTIWNQPALASSASNIASHTRNGNTPAGIHHLDGVMPAADQQISFGKFRRLIMNFTPKSNQEALTRSLLPTDAEAWWMPAIIARNVGRSLLRIHGTGKINTDPSSPWFPFMRTSGCVAQRENTYEGVEYRDQENLLNTLMTAQGLEPRFENHPKLKGLFYIIDVDDKSAPVTLQNLESQGIGL